MSLVICRPHRIWLVILGSLILALSAPCMGENLSQALFRKGYDQFQRSDYANAVISFRRGLETSPDDALAHFYLGRAYSGLGQGDAAIAEFAASLSADSRSSVAVQAVKQILAGRTFAGEFVGDDSNAFKDGVVACTYKYKKSFTIIFDSTAEINRMTESYTKINPTFDNLSTKNELWSQDDQDALNKFKSVPYSRRLPGKLQEYKEAMDLLESERKKCFQSEQYLELDSVVFAKPDVTLVILTTLETNYSEAHPGDQKTERLEIMEKGNLLRLTFIKDGQSFMLRAQ